MSPYTGSITCSSPMIGRSRQNIRKIFLRGRQSNDIKPVLPTKIILPETLCICQGTMPTHWHYDFSPPICQTVLVGAAHNPDRRNKNVNKLNGILFILTFGLLDSRYKFVFLHRNVSFFFCIHSYAKTNSTVITVTN